MKCLYLFVLIAVCRGFDLKKEPLPAPALIRLTAIPSGFVAEWSLVKSLDNQDPVVGYKLKVWEEETIKSYRYEIKDGVNTLVEEDKPRSIKPFGILAFNKTPVSKPREIVITGADITTAQVDNIKYNIEYEIRVLAFTNRGDGRLSEPMKIKLIQTNSSLDKDVYTVA